MSAVMNLVFPELLYLNEYGGNFDNYFNAVYDMLVYKKVYSYHQRYI